MQKGARGVFVVGSVCDFKTSFNKRTKAPRLNRTSPFPALCLPGFFWQYTLFKN